MAFPMSSHYEILNLYKIRPLKLYEQILASFNSWIKNYTCQCKTVH